MITNKDDIQNSADMVDVAQTLGLEMKRSGSVWAIRCPNHFEGRFDKNIGNCYIRKDHKGFICKSCGNSGDIFTLIMQSQGYTFIEALNWLSDYTGIEIEHAHEGQIYQDSSGRRKTARKIISYDDQQFLNIHNEPVSTVEEIITDYETARLAGADSVTDEKGEILYWVKKRYEGNALQVLASENYQFYKKLIEKYCFFKYSDTIRRAKGWSCVDGELYDVAMADITKDIFRIRRIFEEIGGDPTKVKLPKKKKTSKTVFSIGLQQVF